MPFDFREKSTYDTSMLNRYGKLAIVVLAVLWIIIPLFNMWGKNPAGYYTVKQDFISGTMRIFTKSGLFTKALGKTWKYQLSDVYYFSKHPAEGREVDEAISVRFNDGGTADVTGNVRFIMSETEESRILLHHHYRNWDNFITMGAGKVIEEAVILTASLMTSEESYATKRSLFSEWCLDQVQHGVYLTEEKIIEEVNPLTKEKSIKRYTDIKRSLDGEPERKDDPLGPYKIKWSQFVIKEIDYEPETLKLIKKKQTSLQNIITKRADADKARQERITAEEVGKKSVVESQYRAEMEKKRAVVNAQRDLEVAVTEAQKKLRVAELQAKAAEQGMKANILRGEAEYQVARKRLAADGALALKADTLRRIVTAWATAIQEAQQPLAPEITTEIGVNGITIAQTIMDIITKKLCDDLGIDIRPRLPAELEQKKK